MTTGCYRRRERDCVFDGDVSRIRTCVHCGCPESERSIFQRDFAEERALRARLERARVIRRAAALRDLASSRITQALAETRANNAMEGS